MPAIANEVLEISPNLVVGVAATVITAEAPGKRSPSMHTTPLPPAPHDPVSEYAFAALRPRPSVWVKMGLGATTEPVLVTVMVCLTSLQAPLATLDGALA